MTTHYSHWLFRLPGFRNYDGICLGRTILFRQPKGEVSARLLRHEEIHQEQMARHGVIGFYVRYLGFYVAGLVRYRSHSAAYRNNSFEVEAYAREGMLAAEDTGGHAGAPELRSQTTLRGEA